MRHIVSLVAVDWVRLRPVNYREYLLIVSPPGVIVVIVLGGMQNCQVPWYLLAAAASSLSVPVALSQIESERQNSRPDSR